jgi:hypothetical protein
MHRDLHEKQRLRYRMTDTGADGDRGLQAVLWTTWTLAVVAMAYRSWHADLVAQRSFDLSGLVVHGTLTGLVGLLVMTMIEIQLEPWRFLDM